MLEYISETFLPHLSVLGLILGWIGIRAGLKRDNAADWLQLKQLSDKGVNLEAPREVEFLMFVRTEASARHLAERLAAEGYKTAHEPGGYQLQKRGKPAGDREDGHFVTARKVVKLYGDTLKTVRGAFGALAAKENGKYLGWQAIDRSPLGQRATS